MKLRTLRPSQHIPKVNVYRDVVDSRRGLSSLIEHELGHDPFSGVIYVFGNRQRNKIKCLFWEDNGFVLYYKALAEERFHWPTHTDELIRLTDKQLNWLLDVVP